MNATAGSLDEAERACILEVAGRCNWRIRVSNGVAALLDIEPTTLESASKNSACPQVVTPNFRRLSEFSENSRTSSAPSLGSDFHYPIVLSDISSWTCGIFHIGPLLAM